MTYDEMGLDQFLSSLSRPSQGSGWSDRGSVRNTIFRNESITDSKVDSLNANKITAGTIDANTIAVVNLSATNITTGTMSANYITGGTMSANYLTAGSINATNVNLYNLNADNITTGTMSANYLTAGSINATNVNLYNLNADNITTGTMSANYITGGTMSANYLTAGSINSSVVNLYNLNADNITSGSLSANYLSAGTINADSINLTNLNGENIKGTTINGSSIKDTEVDARILKTDAVESDKIKANAVTAEKISVGTISAISANLGTVTSGLVDGLTVRSSSGDSKIQLTTGNRLEFYQGGSKRADIYGVSSGAITSGAWYFSGGITTNASQSPPASDGIYTSNLSVGASGIKVDDMYDRSQGFVECHDGLYISDDLTVSSWASLGGDLDMNSHDINECTGVNPPSRTYVGTDNLLDIVRSMQNTKDTLVEGQRWAELDHDGLHPAIKKTWKKYILNKKTGERAEEDREGYGLFELVLVQNRLLLELSERIESLETIVINLLKDTT